MLLQPPYLPVIPYFWKNCQPLDFESKGPLARKESFCSLHLQPSQQVQLDQRCNLQSRNRSLAGNSDSFEIEQLFGNTKDPALMSAALAAAGLPSLHQHTAPRKKGGSISTSAILIGAVQGLGRFLSGIFTVELFQQQ